MAAFALQFGHGVGLSIGRSRYFEAGIDRPSEVIEEGMVFALETYWRPKTGGARHELKRKW